MEDLVPFPSKNQRWKSRFGLEGCQFVGRKCWEESPNQPPSRIIPLPKEVHWEKVPPWRNWRQELRLELGKMKAWSCNDVREGIPG